MKKYRLKIPLYDRGIQYEVGDLFALDYDCYKADESTKCLNKDFVENNPDIFEKVEEKPKYEFGDWVKTNCNKVGKITGLNGTGMESIFVEGTGWIYESQIKCKVKPVKLQFGLCKNKMGYYIPQTYFDVNTSILNNPDYHSTHSITIYEEVEE